ncbi:MAG: hypothetical protein D6729_06570 [Deltaproteobacteria bacterium]|nr:MAG: hypothetical protein D6729_06570 [Deltaproteobacteria bacterium]
MRRTPALVLLTTALPVAVLVGAAACAQPGEVLLDLCTPGGASDPYEGAVSLEVEAQGEVEARSRFSLAEGPRFEEPLAYPQGATITLEARVLDEAETPLARGTTPPFTVAPKTEVCICLVRTPDAALCQGRGCRYLADEQRCTFFDR